MDQKELISIGEAADILEVSPDTLRRWDKAGKLTPTRSESGYRMYSRSQIEIYMNDLFLLADEWASLNEASDVPNKFYCQNSAAFQTKVIGMQEILAKIDGLENLFPLIGAVVGEIGNNSFDHNLGNWPDIPGIFFGYDTQKRIIVLADRGRGILATLKRVRPTLTTHQEALRVAFTEIISGRAPEERGNGLKFVREVITKHPM